MDELEVRRAVRKAYGRRAEEEQGPAGACCGTSVPLEDLRSAAPAEPPRLGVGDTVGAAELKPGEIVVDLGSGPGADVLRAARAVGPTGRAIGVDATPEMVYRAREEAKAQGLAHAEFRLGEIEHLPLDAQSVDVVLSDCVINLSPDKAQVFRDAFRVLRPGGRIVVSDVQADEELPDAIRSQAATWCACVAGAVREEDYVRMLRDAGFEEISARSRGTYTEGLHTAVITARRPPTAR